jgi:hypothetical protein
VYVVVLDIAMGNTLACVSQVILLAMQSDRLDLTLGSGFITEIFCQ